MLMLMLMPDQRKAMLTVYKREWAETSLVLNHREGQSNMTLAFKVLEIWVGVTFLHFPSEKYRPRGEVESDPFVCRWRIRWTKAYRTPDS